MGLEKINGLTLEETGRLLVAAARALRYLSAEPRRPRQRRNRANPDREDLEDLAAALDVNYHTLRRWAKGLNSRGPAKWHVYALLGLLVTGADPMRALHQVWELIYSTRITLPPPRYKFGERGKPPAIPPELLPPLVSNFGAR
jgi:hypothetical protein